MRLWLQGIFLAFALFKPVTAILINLIFYLFKIPTGREEGASGALAPAGKVRYQMGLIGKITILSSAVLGEFTALM